MKKILLSLSAVLLLSACSSSGFFKSNSQCNEMDIAQFQRNTAMLLHVNQGLNMSEVLKPELMGEPDYKEIYDLGNNLIIEGFYYPVGSESCYEQHPVRYTHSPIFFEEGYVTATGYDYYQWKILPNIAKDEAVVEKEEKESTWKTWMMAPVNQTKDFFNLLLK